jgi:C4-dicarboxylate transporter DctQ subunit
VHIASLVFERRKSLVFKMINKILTYFENTLIVSGLLGVAFVLFINVVLRYVFKSGIVWAEEFARYAIIWIVMAGSGAAVRENMHMRITAIIDVTKNKTLHFIINMLVLVVSTAFSIFLIYAGIRLTLSMVANNQVSPALEIPLWWIYVSIPIGGFLMTIRYIQSFFMQLAEYKKVKQGDLVI